jgi:hypothetical protein
MKKGMDANGKSNGRQRFDGTRAAIPAMSRGKKIKKYAILFYSLSELRMRVSIDEND